MTLNQHLASKQEIPRETLLILNRDTGAQEYRSTLELEVLENFSSSIVRKFKKQLACEPFIAKWT